MARTKSTSIQKNNRNAASRRQLGLPPTKSLVQRPTTSNYTQEQFYEAAQRVRDGDGLRETARNYNIPTMNLSNRVKGLYPNLIGQPPKLSANVEKLLVSCLDYLSVIGYGLQFKEIQIIVELFPPDGLLGRKWFSLFRKRHQDQLSMKTAQHLPTNRADSVNENCVSNFFDLVKRLLSKGSIFNG